MAKFVIRPATAADCSDILRLIKVAGKAQWGRWGWERRPFRPPLRLRLRRFPFLRPLAPGLAAPLLPGLLERELITMPPRLPPTPFFLGWPGYGLT